MIPRIKTKARLPERERVLSAVAEVAAESPALEARVFGSWARGTQSRRSDLDVLIIEETTEPFLRRLDRYLLPLYQAAGGPPVGGAGLRAVGACGHEGTSLHPGYSRGERSGLSPASE